MLRTHPVPKAFRPLLAALFALALLPASVSAEAAAGLSFDEAAKVALTRVPGGEVRSIERDTHFGREVFEVEVRTSDGCEHEVVVSAADGKVVRVKVDCD